MTELSFQYVNDCKNKHTELLRNTNVKFNEQLKYRTTSEPTSKNIYEADDKNTFSAFNLHVKHVTDLNNQIMKGMGKKRWKPVPLIRRNVRSVVIWESAAYGVSDVLHTAESIIQRLTSELKKLSTTPHKHTKDLTLINELRRQIASFSRYDPSEEFRLRSKASIDTIVKLVFADERDNERVRLNQSGLFLEPKIRDDGTYEPITFDKSNGNLGGESVYDLIEPINYYFAKKGNLYRIKDVERLRQEKELFSINNIINRDLASKKQ